MQRILSFSASAIALILLAACGSGYSAWIPSPQVKAAARMGETLGRLIASKRHLKAA